MVFPGLCFTAQSISGSKDTSESSKNGFPACFYRIGGDFIGNLPLSIPSYPPVEYNTVGMVVA